MTTQENKAIVRQFFEAIDTDNLTAIDDILSPDIAEGWRGGMNSKQFSEHHVTVTDMLAEGDQVMARIATRGIHSGEWEGIPATGKLWTNRGVACFRLEQGKIVEQDWLFDALGHLKQLGATIAPPASATA
jgi:ketosteroid isomerase-like protein